jgi:PLP dependent protein
MGVTENLESITKHLIPSVKLVAVSKTISNNKILETYHAGIRIFGENKVQELMEKQPLLPEDIEWHFIGHLQTNKVKYITSFIRMIHSIDSMKILLEVNRQALLHQRIIDCLLQFHIAAEESKFGLSYEDAVNLLESTEYNEMKNVRICGVMGMSTFTTDEKVYRSEFRGLKAIFERLKKNYFESQPQFKEISMGMTCDYNVAIEEGSTMIRIGTGIFGERTYN